MTPLDLQVNGFAGTDFNTAGATKEQLHDVCLALKKAGASQILPTVITDSLPRMRRCLEQIAEFRESDPLGKEVIAGVHIEGPFLNEAPGYIGAHPAQHALPANVDAMRALLDAAGGLTKIVTLAPERDPGFAVTRFLANQGIVVSAGHCDSTLDQLRGAIDAGLSMFTHLGNGCPVQLHRHDNIIQRVLSLAEHLWITFIPDGVHIPFHVLRNYLRSAGMERCIAVTDCIAAAGLGPGLYKLGSVEIRVGEDNVARSGDGLHFAGSTVTMGAVMENLKNALGLSEGDVVSLVDKNPRKALHLSNDQ